MCFCCVMLRPLNHRQQMMDCTFTYVLAGGPRAVTELDYVKARVMCERRSYLVPDRSHYILSFCFFFNSKDGLAPS